MCNNCSCDHQHQCSIVGYFPIGFCCSYCITYDEAQICHCEESETKAVELHSDIKREVKLISATIEGKLLKVVIEQEGEEIPLHIDIKKYIESKKS
jgi:hypothetical protein